MVLDQTAIFLFSVGAAAGGFVTILISLVLFFVNGRIRSNREKQKELIGKIIGGYMEDVNNLFTSYRLSDIEFGHMERESRELLSKISLEVRDNLSLISASYITIIDRYVEEKTESLIAVKDDLTRQNTPQPIQDMSVTSQISGAINEPFNTATQIGDVEATIVDAKLNIPTTESAQVVQATPTPVVAAPEEISPKKGDSFEDLASFIEGDAPSADGFVGGGQAESAFGEAQEFRLDNMPSLDEPVTPTVEAIQAAPTLQAPPTPAAVIPPPPASAPLTPPAPAANPFAQQQTTPPPTPRADPFAAPQQSVPAPQFQNTPDVDATQEFKLDDIMNSAQDLNQSIEQPNDGMLSGDDVASKLDSFFS
jgi:hypothetical protein